MSIISLILFVVLVVLIFLTVEQKKQLDTEIRLNNYLAEKQAHLKIELELTKKENELLQDEVSKIPKVEKVSKPRGRKPGSTNKKKESK